MTSSASRWCMSSEVAVRVLMLASILGLACADVERGPRPPGPDAAPDTGPLEAGAGSDSGGISFASVRPLIDDQCRRCHVAGGMADNSSFLLAGDATAEYTAVRALVDVAAPTQSRLLLKAAGQNHGGGVVYRPTSPEYAALLAWIQAGAAP
jgi:hypothetical protein